MRVPAWMPWLGAAVAAGGIIMSIMDNRTYKGTTFGGIEDIWDVAYSPAYLWSLRPGETPAEYYARIPARQRAFLLPSMATAKAFPMVEAFLYPAGKPELKIKRVVRGRISAFLNANNVLYCAYEVTLPATRDKARAGKAFLDVTANGVQLRLPIIDHGPSGDKNKIIDMSPYAYKLLGLDKNNKITAVKRILL